MVERGLRYSTNVAGKPSGRTRWPGRNLRASGLGVVSFWIKKVRAPREGPPRDHAVECGGIGERRRAWDRTAGALETRVLAGLRHCRSAREGSDVAGAECVAGRRSRSAIEQDREAILMSIYTESGVFFFPQIDDNKSPKLARHLNEININGKGSNR
jgi:hypothetical protein